MKKNLLKSELKNIANKKSLVVVFGMFFIALVLFLSNGLNVANYDSTTKNFYPNQIKKVLAAEEKPLVCRKQTEISLPVIPFVTIDAKFGPNEFEIPTGQVTDMTESVAERIMTELQKIIDASILEAAAAGQMINLGSQCGIGRCTTSGCNDCSGWEDAPCPGNPALNCPIWKSCCNIPACGGQACPSGISDQLQEVVRQANIVSSAYNEIRGILIDWHIKQPISQWWNISCDLGPFSIGCLTEKEFILEELERARSGDYKIIGGWERRPPGLNDCVIRPQDMEEVLKGEKTGKYLFSCREGVAAGVIESNTCYGYNEATEQNQKKAENYYCCE